MEFVAVDVETANADRSSICQIGIACFENGRLSNGWKSLVNPEDYFDAVNISLHGIDEHTVRFSPTWREIYPLVAAFTQGKIVVSHSKFDDVALHRACHRATISMWECQWLDSVRVVRRAWPKFSKSGYGLANLAQQFGIDYQAHDALEDARCAGEIVVRAVIESGLTLDEWLVRARQPIYPFDPSRTDLEPNPNGPLYGEVMAFTGALGAVTRAEAMVLASTAGCQVAKSVTKKTTLLVVGDQDVRKLAGHQKSGTHRKAEEQILRGGRILIISEADFLRMVTDPNG